MSETQIHHQPVEPDPAQAEAERAAANPANHSTDPGLLNDVGQAAYVEVLRNAPLGSAASASESAGLTRTAGPDSEMLQTGPDLFVAAAEDAGKRAEQRVRDEQIVARIGREKSFNQAVQVDNWKSAVNILDAVYDEAQAAEAKGTQDPWNEFDTYYNGLRKGEREAYTAHRDIIEAPPTVAPGISAATSANSETPLDWSTAEVAAGSSHGAHRAAADTGAKAHDALSEKTADLTEDVTRLALDGILARAREALRGGGSSTPEEKAPEEKEQEATLRGGGSSTPEEKAPEEKEQEAKAALKILSEVDSNLVLSALSDEELSKRLQVPLPEGAHPDMVPSVSGEAGGSLEPEDWLYESPPEEGLDTGKNARLNGGGTIADGVTLGGSAANPDREAVRVQPGTYKSQFAGGDNFTVRIPSIPAPRSEEQRLEAGEPGDTPPGGGFPIYQPPSPEPAPERARGKLARSWRALGLTLGRGIMWAIDKRRPHDHDPNYDNYEDYDDEEDES